MTITNITPETSFFKRRKREVSLYLNKIIPIREQWINKNKYYYNILRNYLKFIIQDNKRILQIKSDTGFFLKEIQSSYALGIEEDHAFIAHLKRNYPDINFKYGVPEELRLDEKFDYVISINSIGLMADVRKFFNELQKVIDDESRVIIIYYNKLWEYVLKFAELVGFKIKTPEQNWLSNADVENLLYLSDFEIIKRHSFILLPIYIPIISWFLNSISRLPFINKLCFVQSVIARRIPRDVNAEFTCSIIVPCKDEEGNIRGIVKRVPKIGKHTELIFVDDKSTDTTRKRIEEEITNNSNLDIKLVDGPGVCKAEAVWKGFEAASGEILFILDADLSVQPEELIHFYSIIASKKGEFINGSRLVYPMEGKAMKLANLAGNKFFSFMFSYILGQNIKDTLCGTKALFKKDFQKIKRFIGTWGLRDRWGDYELLFGAARLNLKIVDLPVHYCQRFSGASKMTGRLKNGLVMLMMCIAAFNKLKN